MGLEGEKDSGKSNCQEKCDLNSVKILNQIFLQTYTPANMVFTNSKYHDF